jgi:hypothetical protein
MSDREQDDQLAVVARLAENEARFRTANEQVAAKAEELDVLSDLVPFLCECGRLQCVKIIRVLLGDYERIRSIPNHFIYAAGHEDGIPGSRRIETLAHAVVVEKDGVAGRIAEQTDPRRD